MQWQRLADCFPRGVCVEHAERLATPADTAWALIGDLTAIELAGGVVERIEIDGAGSGAVRTVHLRGGQTLVERIEDYDAAARCYVYRLLDYGPLCFVNYLGCTRVAPAGPGHCLVSWVSCAQPLTGYEEQTRALFEQNMDVLFGVLRRRFGTSGAGH